MPLKSEAQKRFMYASLAGNTNVPPSVAKKFVGPEAHKESDMKKPLPAFMMKKDDKKDSKKPAKASPFAKGKKFAFGGDVGDMDYTAGQRGIDPEALRRLMGARGAPAAPMRRGAPAMPSRAQAFAKGGGIESKGKTKGKVC